MLQYATAHVGNQHKPKYGAWFIQLQPPCGDFGVVYIIGFTTLIIQSIIVGG